MILALTGWQGSKLAHSFYSQKFWLIGSYRDRGWMSGEARKTPPQNRPTTVNPRDPKFFCVSLTV
jgi:hypothetical protein